MPDFTHDRIETPTVCDHGFAEIDKAPGTPWRRHTGAAGNDTRSQMQDMPQCTAVAEEKKKIGIEKLLRVDKAENEKESPRDGAVQNSHAPRSARHRDRARGLAPEGRGSGRRRSSPISPRIPPTVSDGRHEHCRDLDQPGRATRSMLARSPVPVFSHRFRAEAERQRPPRSGRVMAKRSRTCRSTKRRGMGRPLSRSSARRACEQPPNLDKPLWLPLVPDSSRTLASR